MSYFEMIVKIVLYFVLVFSMYLYLKSKNKKGINKFSIFAIILFSLLFGLYSVISGNLSDRMRYGNFFSNSIYDYIIQRDSLGLFSLYKLLHIFTFDRYVLFFCVSFLFCLISMIAYNNSKSIRPLAFLLLGISNYFVWGLMAFKQCLSVAFMALSWTYYLKDKNKKYILFLIISILFHESALIMIPIIICLNTLNRSKLLGIPLYFGLILSIVFFNQISNFIFSLASKIPELEFQMSSYFDEYGSIQNELNIFTVFKGLPFLLIAFYGFIKKPSLEKNIDHYDKYLFITFVCSVTFVLSLYMYWMWRFGMFLLFPTFSFFSQILDKYKNGKDNKYIFAAVVLLLLFITTRYFIQCYFTYGGIY